MALVPKLLLRINKMVKKKGNLVKQLPVMPKGIRSTLSSLNMKVSAANSIFSGNLPSNRNEAKKPPKAKIIENKKFGK